MFLSLIKFLFDFRAFFGLNLNHVKGYQNTNTIFYDICNNVNFDKYIISNSTF